jgi:hypothetical protein
MKTHYLTAFKVFIVLSIINFPLLFIDVEFAVMGGILFTGLASYCRSGYFKIENKELKEELENLKKSIEK